MSVFFNDPATTEIYTLSLHDALPISPPCRALVAPPVRTRDGHRTGQPAGHGGERRPHPIGLEHHLRVREPQGGEALRGVHRSEEHTSELQSRQYLVCRLLLEKKKKQQ